jgi:hypothetical protein
MAAEAAPEAEMALAIELGRELALSGESVAFRVRLTHTANAPVELVSLAPNNRALEIVLQAEGGGTRRANGMARLERDGVWCEDSGERDFETVGPGDAMTAEGDLLEWFGEVPEGRYKVHAAYRAGLVTADSPTAELRVLRRRVVGASWPRWGAQSPKAPLAGIWAHRESPAEPFVAVYHQQSPRVPRNAWHGVRVIEGPARLAVNAACVPLEDMDSAHAWWAGKDGQLHVMPIDMTKLEQAEPVPVQTPWPGTVLDSPMSMPDGTLLVPFTDMGRRRFALLRVQPDGSAEALELKLGREAPMGTCLCFWEYSFRFHFAWVCPNRRQVEYAMVPLDDLVGGFVTRTARISNDPIVHLAGYMDAELPPDVEQKIWNPAPEEADEDVEIPPDRFMLWCVAGREGKLVCTPVEAATAAAESPTAFSTADLSGATVIDSAVTSEHGLSLLLADGGDVLHYASAALKRVASVESLTGKAITRGQSPGLTAACRHAFAPWVHLRYVSEAGGIEFERLEPADKQDPVEKLTGRPTRAAKPAEEEDNALDDSDA